LSSEKSKTEEQTMIESSRPSRRQILAGAVMLSAGLELHTPRLFAESDEISRTAESIHQESLYPASPQQVFDALTDTSQFDRIIRIGSGADISSLGNKPTSIGREAGASFTIFGGHIIGRQIELVPNVRIVQAWRVVDWVPGIYSIAKFAMVEQGSKTRIVFDHTGFPQGLGKHLAEGWKSHYWDPLGKYLAAGSK
jgi:uncharacterized protein YndB with AHSA1/START domain